MNGLVYFKPSGLVRGYTPGLASGGISFDQNAADYLTAAGIIDAIASVTLPSYALYLGAQNRAGSAIEFCAKEYALAYISSALSQTEQANLYTAVQAFQTALGRNV